MAGFGRRLVVSLTLALAAMAVAVPGTLAGRQATTPRLTIAVHLGFHDTVKQGDWMPLVIDLTNNGSDLDGRVEVTASSPLAGKGGPPAGASVYELPISLAAGATKHLRTHVIEDQQGSVTVRVSERGRLIATQTVNAGNSVSVLIGVLSDQPASLDRLASINPGNVATSVVHLTSDDIPESGLLLRPFDLLAIDDYATDVLTAGQRAAIGDYVMNGGALLLGTGGSWRKTLAGLPAQIVPMAVTGSKILPASAELGGMAGVEVATGTAAGKTQWLSDGGQPLIVEAAVGDGWVEMASFDWNQDSIAGWAGTTALLRQAFVRASFGVSLVEIAVGGGPGIGSITARSSGFAQVLSNLPSLDLPAWWLIGSLVLLYVLLIGPVNFLVLRAINRRALAWITVPTIAIVASGGAYGIAAATKGRSVQANEVSIIHVNPGWDRAYQEGYTGILTPTRGDYDVAVAGGTTLVSSIVNYNGPGLVDSNQGLIRVDPTGTVITLPGMTAFNLRGFATERITAAPHLVAHATLSGGKVTGTVENLSSTSFTDGVVIAGNGYQTFGRLAPGASASFSVAPSIANPFNGPAGYSQIYPDNGFAGPPPANTSSDAVREAIAKTAVLATLPVSGFKGFSLSAVPTVVVWNTQPYEELSVNGIAPRSYAITGVALPIPIDGVGPGKLPAGVVAGRLIDVDGDAQQNGGPPGTLVMNSGAVTYDFLPPQGSGGHLVLHDVTVDSSNPFGVKGQPIGPNGSSGTVSAQVWDWAESSWIDVVYNDSASTSVPDAAVNPVTGEVRLKLTSDGTYASGWLTLGGTVQ